MSHSIFHFDIFSTVYVKMHQDKVFEESQTIVTYDEQMLLTKKCNDRSYLCLVFLNY